MKGFEYTFTDSADFVRQGESSYNAQREIEASDEKDFDTFISDYFAEPPAKKNA